MQRRDFMALGAATLASGLTAATAADTVPEPRATHPEMLTQKPLAFDPKKLDGISEKMIVSHHDNNYAGAVKRSRAIEEKIAALNSSVNPFELGALKREQMVALNSMILHEYYFDALGTAGAMESKLKRMLELSFRTVGEWENEFKKTALSLGGGSGWVLLVYNARIKRLENVWSWDHMHGLWDSKIILALDMYEHSYQMDFGANAKGYIDAFFKNINWDVVNARIGAIA
ncbi:MAG: Fe-Mn family superoxide dismutase [Epsilonproteobacteria bacterium]|nr:Fe-Mn family superoxide dismutase [Campylobacterota bacterium]